MDKSTVNRISDGFDPMSLLTTLAAFLQTYWFPLAITLLGWAAFNAVRSSSLFAQIWRNLEENVFHNWRLVVLGITGLILSLASGWTTWDGMRNFTHEPVLSLMITIGIQGVMLIVAWLIGESFATGMSQRNPDGTQTRSATEATMGTAIGVLLFVAVAAWAMRFLSVEETVNGVEAGVNWGNVANGAIVLVIAMLALASMLMNRNSDVVTPYLQGTRVIAKNAVLWVMFLACMGTSVFFSFDSLFANIFPANERARAATIRTTNQVAGLVADIGALTERRRLASAEQLFNTGEWQGYETQLTRMSALAQTAPGLIREQVRRELEEQNRQLKALQEKQANALSSQAGLAARKVQLNEEISRLSGLRPGIMNETLEPKRAVAAIRRELDEQRARTLAEEKGVEGSLKIGRGPKYRESRAAEGLMVSRLQVAERRLRNADDRLKGIDRRVAAGKAELAQIDGDLAKLKGEAATAEQLIAVTRGNNDGNKVASYDPAAGLAKLERTRQAFHQNPTQKKLIEIQNNCSVIHSAMMRVTSLRERAGSITCDPGSASEAAAPVFALNSGIAAFNTNCAGGSNLPQSGGTDAMLRFGRKCLQDSGLTSRDTAALSAKLSSVELSRDDKAHRFVVTWNAFNDGNSLAYLALAIAIAIDALVFMSGLFGANVVRSPLSDVPSGTQRSAKQLEAIIDNALLPERFDNASFALAAMHPITPTDGYAQEVILEGHNAQHDDRVRKVLNAGATIGAVRRQGPGHFQVRSELFEFLSIVARREFDNNASLGKQSELEQIIAVALLPEVGGNAERVLGTLHPIDENNGFTSEVFINEIDPLTQPVLRNVLNAGSTMQVVQRDKEDTARYYIHADLYKTLARIRATALFRPAGAGHKQLSGSRSAALPPPAYGGNLNDEPAATQLPASGSGTKLISRQNAPADIQNAGEPASQKPPARIVSLTSLLNRPPPAEQAQGFDDGPAAPMQTGMRPIDQRRAADAPHEDPRLRQHIREQLAHAIGLASDAYQQLISSGSLLDSRATKAALNGLGQRAPKYLGKYFTSTLSEFRQRLQRAYQNLAEQHANNAAYIQNLDQIAQEFTEELGPLMLTHNGPYETLLARLLSDFEDPSAKGKLKQDEAVIGAKLRVHMEQLNKNSRQTAGDWQAVAQLIAHYDENVSVMVPTDAEQRRPN